LTPGKIQIHRHPLPHLYYLEQLLISPPVHLSPFLSAPHRHQRPLTQSCYLVDDTERIGSASPSTTLVAPNLLQRRQRAAHRICYPFNESRPTGSATTSATASSLDLPPLRRILSHRLCYNVNDCRLTGSATPSTNPAAPDQLHSRQPITRHQI
jgi:hypothetical protein